MAIGTAAAIIGGAALGGATTLIAGGKAAGAARDASQVQAQSAQQQVQESRRQFDLTRSDFAPFRETGAAADSALRSLFGLDAFIPQQPAPTTSTVGSSTMPASLADFLGRNGGRIQLPNDGLVNLPVAGDVGTPAAASTAATTPTGPQGLDIFFESPGYQFNLNEGLKTIDRINSANGTLNSGNRFKDAAKFTSGLASNEFGNFFNQLNALRTGGQAATTSNAAIGAGLTGQINQALGNSGAARASGIIGAGNANAAAIQGVGQSIGQGLSLLPFLNSSGGGGGNLAATSALPSVGNFPALNTAPLTLGGF